MAHRTTSSIRDNYVRLKAAQKGSRGAPLYSVVINRPLGRAFAAVAHRWGMTPNQVTVVSALFTFAGIGAIALLEPGVGTALGVTAALVVGYALDAADGQLARLRGGGSLTGEWLDHVIDSFKIATVHLAVLLMMYRHFDTTDLWLLVPVLFAAVSVIHFFGMLLTELLVRTAGGVAGPATSGPVQRGMSLLKLPTDYGVFCLAMLTLAVPALFQWVYLGLLLAMAGYTALVLGVWYRRLRSVESHRSTA